MAPWLRAYPLEVPTTPPTPCPSPTGLAHLGLHTAFPHHMPENGDPKLQFPSYSLCGTLFKRPKATRQYATRSSNAEGRPFPTEINSQIQKDAQHGEWGQQRCSSPATQFSEARPELNDGSACWRDTYIIQSPTHAIASASTLLDLGPIKLAIDDFSIGSVPLDTNAGNHCSNHPLVICGLTSGSNAPGVNFDCPKVGPVNGGTMLWNGGSEVAFAETTAEEKEGNDYVTRRDASLWWTHQWLAGIYGSKHEI